MKYYFSLKFECLFVLFALPLSLFAQDRANSIEFTPQISLASFSAEEIKIVGPIVSGDLAYHLNKVGYPRLWMKHLNVSSVDVVFTYQNSGSAKAVRRDVAHPIGNSYALTSGLSFSLHQSKKSNVYLSAATGLGYFDKAGLVNENIVLGSNLNYCTKFQLRAESSLSSNSTLSAMIGFYHLSNGGIRIPNNGLNVISVGLGFKQYFKPKSNDHANFFIGSAFEKNYKKNSFDFGATMGATGMLTKNKLLYKTDLYAGYNYRLSTMLGVSLGTDAIYNFTTYDIENHYETYQGYASSPAHWRVGLGMGPDIWLGRFAMMAKMGYYLSIKTVEGKKPTYRYSTVGFKYHFTNCFAAQTKVHLHKTEAEFVGFGLIFSK